MANEIQTAFNTVYAKGPISNPGNPDKDAIRNVVGGTIQSQFDSLAVVAAGKWVSFDTKATMNASLVYPADTEGRVYNDGANNGVYKKTGTSGTGAWSFVGPIPESDNTDLQKTIDTVSDTVNQGTGDAAPIFSEARAVWAVTDENGLTPFFLDENGEFHFVPSNDVEGVAIEILAGDIIWGVADADGWLCMWVTADGQVHGVSGVADVYMAAERGAVGARNIVLVSPDGRTALLSYDEGDNYSPQVRQSDVRWIGGQSGAETIKSMLLPTAPTAILNAEVTGVVHILTAGQSLSVSFQGGPGLDTAPLNPGRGVMFSGGEIPGNTLDDTAVLPDSALSTFSNAIDGTVTNGTRAVDALVNALPSTQAVLYSAHGVNGRPYSALKKGTTPYRNSLRAVLRGRLLAMLGGLDFKAPYINWIQGENNYTDSQTTYLSHLIELQSDYDADVKAITGQADDVVVFLNQCSSWTKYANLATADGVPLAQLQAAIDHPDKFVCIGPKYQFPYFDGVHTTNVGQRRTWEMHGAAMAAIEAGDPWTPLYPISAIRAGAVVTVLCNVPVGSLTIDTALVSDPGAKGVKWADNGDGNSVTVSSVVVADATHLTVTLSAAPTGTGGQLRFALDSTAGVDAGPTTGPRCCIRDQSTLVSVDGSHLYNWMCHSQVAVA